jgi:hypothetical protein
MAATLSSSTASAIPHRHPRQPAGRSVVGRPEDDLANLLEPVQLAFGADHVAALALVYVAGGNRGVGGAHRLGHVADRQAEAGEQLRLHRDVDFLFAAAVDGHPADARYPLDAVLDDILDEVAEFVHRPLVALGPADDEPGDRAVLAAGGVEGRLVGLLGIAGHPVETVGHQQQGPVHVGADGKLQGDAAAPLFGAPGDLAQALQAGHLLFLPVGDLALDFGRRRAGPIGPHRNDRTVDVRGQLDRDVLERHQAEHHHHEHGRDHRDRPVYGSADEVHQEAPSMRTLSPGRRRSLPRTTTMSPSSSPLSTS